MSVKYGDQVKMTITADLTIDQALMFENFFNQFNKMLKDKEAYTLELLITDEEKKNFKPLNINITPNISKVKLPYSILDSPIEISLLTKGRQKLWDSYTLIL